MGKRPLKEQKAPQIAPVALADIQVLVTGSKASSSAMAYADTLACDHGAHLSAVVFNELPFMPAGFGESPAYVHAWVETQARAVKAGEALEASAHKHAATLSAPVAISRIDLLPDSAMSHLNNQARTCDATVIGLTSGGRDSLERRFVSSALFDSGRPVMIVPEKAATSSAPRHVLIAWSATAEATQAVHEALPLLARADEVRLLVIDDGADSSGAGAEPGVDIARHLGRHHISVEVKALPAGGRAVGEIILTEGRYFGADLIVMGGYGHTRLREWIFGGATRDVIQETTIPVFMMH